MWSAGCLAVPNRRSQCGMLWLRDDSTEVESTAGIVLLIHRFGGDWAQMAQIFSDGLCGFWCGRDGCGKSV